MSNTKNMSDVFIDFIKNLRQLNELVNYTTIIKMSDYPQAEDLLKNIEIPENSFNYKIPIYIVPERILMDIESIKIVRGKLDSTKLSLNLTLTINPNTVTSTIIKIDEVVPVSLMGIIDAELLEVAFGLILQALQEKKAIQAELLQQTGFGEF